MSHVVFYLQVLRSDCCHVGDTKDKTYCVKNIRLSTSIQPRDRIEALVPADRQYSADIVTVAIVYHPEITVRTAYDLKPYKGSASGAKYGRFDYLHQ